MNILKIIKSKRTPVRLWDLIIVIMTSFDYTHSYCYYSYKILYFMMVVSRYLSSAGQLYNFALAYRQSSKGAVKVVRFFLRFDVSRTSHHYHYTLQWYNANLSRVHAACANRISNITIIINLYNCSPQRNSCAAVESAMMAIQIV